MPIDLKWVRDHPELVQQWQCLRYPQQQQQDDIPSNDTPTTTTPSPSVEQLQAWDTQARQLLFQTNQLRRSIKQLSRQLRQATDKSELTRQQEELESLSNQYQQVCAQRDVALQALGSPLDTQVLEEYATGSVVPTGIMSQMDATSSNSLSLQHWQVLQQIRYMCVSRFPGIQIHECIDCELNRDDDGNQTSHYVDMWGTRSLPPPAFIPWLAQQVTPMIWGAKQLPQMLLLESKSNEQGSTASSPSSSVVDLVGLTSGTTWDARSLQMEWMEECRDFFQSIFLGGGGGNVGQTMKLEIRSVPPTQLEQHEQSRLVLLLQIVNNNNNDASGKNTLWYPLAQVSNLGDAPTRALQQQFQGGGLHSSKGYVYMVHARIFSTPWLLAVLQQMDKNGNVLLDTLRLQSNTSVGHYSYTTPVDGKTTNAGSKASKNKKKSVFQPRVPATSTSRQFLSLLKSSGATTEEALTCPFGFLVH